MYLIRCQCNTRITATRPNTCPCVSEACALIEIRVQQVLEDQICACEKSNECTEAENYKRMLYATKGCDYYPAVEAMLSVFDLVFLIFFTLELACKVSARGLILHKHAYLRDSANWLDFVVVVTGILSTIADSVDDDRLKAIGFFDVLRLVRVFRPLRFSPTPFPSPLLHLPPSCRPLTALP